MNFFFYISLWNGGISSYVPVEQLDSLEFRKKSNMMLAKWIYSFVPFPLQSLASFRVNLPNGLLEQ